MLGNCILLYCYVGQEEIGETEETMQEDRRKIIRRNFEILSKDLDPKPLMSFLFQEGIITEDDMDNVNSIKPRKEKSEALLLMLLRKGPNAFLALVEGLITKKKQWLATLLLKEGKCN